MPKGVPFYLIRFYADAYLEAVRKELAKVTQELSKRMYVQARENLENIPFKNNKVRVGLNSFTTDDERKAAVMNSIVQKKIETTYLKVAGSTGKIISMVGGVSALEHGDYRDTHIGLYYEWGTGNNADADGPMRWGLRAWNPYRRPIGVRSPIVSRSVRTDNGVWIDLGGNTRVTKSIVGGRRNEKFLKFVGEDLEAEHWFRDAFCVMLVDAEKEYRKALASIHPAKFMKMPKTLRIG